MLKLFYQLDILKHNMIDNTWKLNQTITIFKNTKIKCYQITKLGI